jgi:hypothetical protein
MIKPFEVSELEDFARNNINSQDHPDDDHIFILFKCNSCGSPIFRLTIEHHTGSEVWNFRGIIWGECSECGYLGRLFTFTGNNRVKVREERPECECGSRIFITGQCERFEGNKGIPGFFDEGVIVGRCTLCNRNRVFVFTD